jgi:hypothetical protein
MNEKISKKTTYVSTSGWRGYIKPVDAVAGANDTGSWEDSPCPTKQCLEELNGFKSKLKKAGIPFRTMICPTSNVCCVSRYILVAPAHREKALEMAREYKKETRLFYPED